MNVFDKHAKLLQRRRASLSSPDLIDYLRDEFGYRLADRVKDVKRRFARVVDYGCGRGHIARHLDSTMAEHVLLVDSCAELLEQVVFPQPFDADEPPVQFDRLLLENEESREELRQALGDAASSLDLVVSSLHLHWINDLPSVLAEFHRALRPDACFIGTMLGGDTLFQLRSALHLAESERDGGLRQHVSPFVSVRDVGSLLAVAGFTLVTIDVDETTISYPSIFHLLQDLKAMGESNAAWRRCVTLPRDTLLAAAAIYSEMYGEDGGERGASIPATFQTINWIGWKPDASKQPEPARRGSGQMSLKDIGRLDDILRERGSIVVDGDDEPKST